MQVRPKRIYVDKDRQENMRYRTKYRKILQVIVFCLLSLVTVPALTTTIDDVRLWRAPDHTRLVFDLSNPASYKLFALDDPHRVVIDIETYDRSNKSYQIKLNARNKVS